MIRRFSAWVNSPKVTGTMLVITTLGCAIASIVAYQDATALERSGTRTVARVLAVHEGRSSYVTATFSTADGHEVVTDVHEYYWRPKPRVGDTASLIYDPDNPSGNVVDSRIGPDFFTVWFAGIAAVVAAVFAWLTLKGRIDWNSMSPWSD